jgi:putative oxidoreductase
MIQMPKFSAERTSRMYAVAELLGRLLIAQLFLAEAVSKLGQYGLAAAYMAHYGVPAELLPLALAVEILGGLAILLGWQTRIAAAILAGFCLATAAIFHSDFADRGQVIHFEKDLALAGAFLILAACGAGRLSLNAR